MSPNYKGATIAVSSIIAFIFFLVLLGNMSQRTNQSYYDYRKHLKD